MKSILSIILLLFLSCQFIICGTGDDTVKVNLNGMNSQYISDDLTNLILEGIRMIRNDSTEKGIESLYKGFKTAINRDSIDRAFDYKSYEMISFLTSLASHTLTKEEQAFGNLFLSTLLKNDPRKINKMIRKSVSDFPQSVFINRINVFILSFGQYNDELSDRIENLLLLDSTLIGANTLKAELLYNDGSYKESAHYFARAFSLFPKYAYAYNGRGMCFYKMNQYEEAIPDIESAIQFFPKLYYAYYNKGNVLQSQKKYELSILEFRKCLALNPNHTWSYRDIAFSFEKLHKPDSALHYYSKAIYKDPLNAWHYDSRGDFYYDYNNYELAIKDYSMAIQYDRFNKYYYADRGDAYDELEMMEEAMNDFKKALAIDSTYDYALKRLGDFYYDKGEYQTAIDFCRKAIAIDPEYKYAYVRMAFGFDGLGDRNEQIKALTKAVSIDTTFSNALGNLGWAYYCANEFDSCIVYSYRAIRYENDAYYAMFNIALATLRLGKFVEAQALYRKYLDIYYTSETDEPIGAIQDLKDLLDKKIQVEEVSYILKTFFNL